MSLDLAHRSQRAEPARPSIRLLILPAFTVLLALACLAGLARAEAERQAHQRARERWQLRQPERYRYVLRWRNSLSQWQEWQVEVQHGQVVHLAGPLSSASSATGPSLTQSLAPVEALFGQIELEQPAGAAEFLARLYPPLPRALSRHFPGLQQWLSPCVAPLPAARYDARWGYPAWLSVERNPCVALMAGTGYLQAEIMHFTPLALRRPVTGAGRPRP